MKHAPVYTHTFDLVAWLLRHVEGGPVADAIHADALALLDHVVLALKGFDRRRRLDEADAVNALLRVRLRLAHELELIDERRLLFCAERLDDIGKQLGGWIRHLDRGGE